MFYIAKSSLLHLHKDGIHQFAYLLVHEYVDEGVDDGAAFSQEGGHHAGNRANNVGGTKGGHHGHNAVRHPAQQITGCCGQDHEKYVVLPLASRSLPDFSHLNEKNRDSI